MPAKRKRAVWYKKTLIGRKSHGERRYLIQAPLLLLMLLVQREQDSVERLPAQHGRWWHDGEMTKEHSSSVITHTLPAYGPQDARLRALDRRGTRAVEEQGQLAKRATSRVVVDQNGLR